MYYFTYLLLFLMRFTISTSENRPRIAENHGNLIIEASRGCNIIFNVSASGKLILQDVDISTLVQQKTLSGERLQTSSKDSKHALAQIGLLEAEMNSNQILTRLDKLENTSNATRLFLYASLRPIRIKIVNIQRRVLDIARTLIINKCRNKPCQNGGTCYRSLNAYQCICPFNWEGANCEADVNECKKYDGTELGCQNNSTCTNTPGGYKCECNNGWYGLHCTKRTQDCTNSVDMCDHGTCIPLVNGYKCLCDQGWTLDTSTKRCTVDVNECETYHPPCSTNPHVECINLPGKFACGSCPSGYTGNGFHCIDIDECQTLNGGCSMYPMVQCVNVPGTRMCGRCPPGYSGDGLTCVFKGLCGIGNGGCHSVAQCTEDSRISATYVKCMCPSGYAGDGYGANGCIKGGKQDPCQSSPCLFGTCESNEYSYTCNCTRRYTGRNCDIRKDGCLSNPCQNGGTCRSFSFSYVCMCLSGFAGGNCELPDVQCGQNLGGSGNMIYPPTDFSFSRKSQINCVVRIQTELSKVINVTIHAVYLQQCRHSYLQINNGKDTSSPLVGRFCDDNPLKNGSSIISMADSLYIWLRGDALASKPFMNISWTSIKPVCGFYLNVTDSGIFTSPGYPQSYPSKRDCYWRFNAPVNKRLKFTFFHLDIGNYSVCNEDFIAFNEGLEPNQKPFFKYCKSGVIEPVLSPSNEVTLQLHTVERHSGFQIKYSLIDGVAGCGGIYTHSSGTISSKLIILDNSDLTCEYKIQLPYKGHLKLQFRRFVNSPSLICSANNFRIAIYEGSSMDAALIGRYCSSSAPADINIYNSEALIVYKYQENTEFELEYQTICGGTYTKQFGVIQSENYPTEISIDQSNPIKCVYIIERPPNNRIEINIDDINLGRYNWDCKKGMFQIFTGSRGNTRKILELCTSKPAKSLYSDENYVEIYYYANSGNVTGFSLSYRSLIDSECGGIETKMSGKVETPRDLHTYEKGLNCTWILSAPVEHVIQLNWLSFNMEKSPDCMYEYVRIFDNITGAPSNMGTYCGNLLPPSMTTTSNMATIIFKIDSHDHYEGFYMSYRFIQHKNLCDGNYFTPSGILRSQNYPLQYPNNCNCAWTITVPMGQQILLNITSFNVENSSNCYYDYLKVLNGGTALSPEIGKFCGTTIPKLIYSHTNQLYIEFRSDTATTGPGFELQWTSAATGCGGTLTSSIGTIISPNYPKPYGRRADCFWKIAVSAGSKVVAMFADLDLEHFQGCRSDYVEFYDGIDTTSSHLGRFCKYNDFKSIISSGNHLSLKFHSDISIEGKGFQLQYNTLCNATLKGYHGVIENPNYPNSAVKPQECNWKIMVPPGNQINITFAHFQLESRLDCNLTYLEVRYKYEYEEKVLGKYCDDNPPEDHINIDSNEVFIKFRFASKYRKAVFRMEWVLNGCGGFLSAPNGVIQTPHYPKPYPLNIECNWNIQAPMGQSIMLIFGTTIDIEAATFCSADAINIYNGPDDSYARLASICEYPGKPILVSGSGSEMFISFTSDASYSGKGFQARYYSRQSKCGGRMSANNGVIHSPNYPKNYDKNDTCMWLIQVRENHLIELDFESVDLLDDCNSTFINVYDGPKNTSPLLKKVCGSNKPNTMISLTNQLYVEFVAHEQYTTKGFKATYTIACGARILTNNSGIISHSSETLVVPYSNNCTWTIVASNPEQHVLLTFSKFVTSCDNSMWGSSMEIYDGDNQNSTLLGSYCRSPSMIRSTGNALRLSLVETYNHISFTAKYSVLESSCGGEILSSSGEISTPNYPNSYPAGIQCEWVLRAGESNIMHVEFKSFDLISSTDCNEDYLEIREKSRSGRLIGIFCGDDKPTNVTAMYSVWMYFKSEKAIVGSDVSTASMAKGFLADFAVGTFVELSGTKGTIISPLYPEYFVPDRSYKWQITTQLNSTIQISFIDMLFRRTDSSSCYSNHLTIYDGSEDDSILGNYCLIAEPITSTTNVVTIVLTGGISMLKFKLQWKQIPKSKTNPVLDQNQCGSQENVLIDNSNYTLSNVVNDTINQNCTWTLQAKPGRHLRAEFLNVKRPILNVDCIDNSIDLSYGNGTVVNQRVCDSDVVGKIYDSNDNFMKVSYKFMSTLKIDRTEFMLNITDVCGGRVTTSNGIISVDGKKEVMNRKQIECKWEIIAKTGKQIQVYIITDFIRSTIGHNKVVVYNGHNLDSPIILERSDISTKESVTTTGNKAFITFSGNKFGKLKIKYRSVSNQDCGGTIELTRMYNSTTIETPKYPQSADKYTECIWVVTVPNGEAVRFDFVNNLRPSNGVECSKEGIEIRDGGTVIAPIIEQLCHYYKLPGTIRSLKNRMYIRYYTNLPKTELVFQANVSIAVCGGTLRGYDISITSPEYNNKLSYPLNVTCVWEIWITKGHIMNITFNNFDLPSDAGFTINDVIGYNNTEIELFNYKGGKPADLQSISHVVKIRFTSGTVGYSDGFKIGFKVSRYVCGGNMNTPSGTIMSPNYPASYWTLYQCIWKIVVPEYSRIKLVFDDLDLAYGQNIRIYNKNQFIALVNSTKQDQKIIRSSDNNMEVWYWALKPTQTRGFKATYTSDEPSLCKSAIDVSQGIITSPTNQQFQCIWALNLEMAENQSLSLSITIENRGIDPSAKCYMAYQSIFVRQDLSAKSRLLSYRSEYYCKSTQEPIIVRMIQAKTSIVAHQNSNSSDFKFTVKYKVEDCGGLVTSTNGFIVSPKDVDVANCVWMLVGDKGDQFSITVNEFNLNDCSTSYLLIYNGYNVISPLLGRYCGDNRPIIRSSYHHLRMEYHGVNASNFNLTYTKFSNICGGTHQQQRSSLQSLNYPNSYEDNVECLWEIRAQVGYQIKLTFADRFQIENSDNCRNDFVAVYDQGVEEKNAQRYCGRTLPPVYTSKSNVLYVLFRTNSRVTGSGFRASWVWACGGHFNATHTPESVKSPSYPFSYSRNLRCEYHIAAAVNSTAPLRITVKGSNEFIGFPCTDLLIVTLMNNTKKYHSICGNDEPIVMYFNTSVNLTFISSNWNYRREYKFTYEISDCGGIINKPTRLHGSTLQHLDDGNERTRSCMWKIVSPKNKRIVISFEKVNITYNNQCKNESVTVKDAKFKEMAALCGDLSNTTLPTIHSNNNQTIVTFKYINNRILKYFEAYVDFIYGPEVGCGGVIDLKDITHERLRFQPPGDNYDCIWHIQTTSDSVIKLSFFTTNTSSQCTSSKNTGGLDKECCLFYQIRDGNTSLADEIFNACDRYGFHGYQTSGSFAQLRIAGRSKTVAVPTVLISTSLSNCGKLSLTATHETQYLTWYTKFLTYSGNWRCLYRIKSQSGDFIHLQIEDMNLNPKMENISSCSGLSRIEIVDSNNKEFDVSYDIVTKQKDVDLTKDPMDRLIGKHTFCRSSDNGYDFVSSTSDIQISHIHETRHTSVGTGYKISYKLASFNRNYTALSGRIAAMHLSGNGTARIIVPQNYTIALFVRRPLSKYECGKTWIIVHDTYKSFANIWALCGSYFKPIFSQGNTLRIELNSETKNVIDTPEMTYIASDQGRGCGGELYAFKGQFTSPLYPNPPTGNIYCRWTVRVPMGLQLALHLRWFDIKGNCEDNFLKISDLSQEGSSQVYCSEDKNIGVFISASGAVSLEYKSDLSNTGTGWMAYFMAITSEMEYIKFKNEH